MAMSDYGGTTLHTFAFVINNTWIIDYGATDHMTFDSRQISSLRHSLQKFISTANCNMTLVIWEGSLTLTDTLNLDSVIAVYPQIITFFFVSQITIALSCIVIFFLEFCVFKDIRTRQTIGCDIKRWKLYYLDLQLKDSNKLQQALMTHGSKGEKKLEIWLWHQQLGHACLVIYRNWFIVCLQSVMSLVFTVMFVN